MRAYVEDAPHYMRGHVGALIGHVNHSVNAYTYMHENNLMIFVCLEYMCAWATAWLFFAAGRSLSVTHAHTYTHCTRVHTPHTITRTVVWAGGHAVLPESVQSFHVRVHGSDG